VPTTIPTPSKNASLRSAPTPAEKKVEQFAKKLRDDIEAQERVLQTYIRTVQTKHEFSKSQKMYKDEAANLKFEKAFLEEIIKYIKLRKC